jgi:hypothetical protein
MLSGKKATNDDSTIWVARTSGTNGARVVRVVLRFEIGLVSYHPQPT